MSITYRNVLAGAAGQTTGSDSDAYQIEKSLRIDSGDQANLSLTPGIGNKRTFTISVWFKRPKIGDETNLLGNYNTTSGNWEGFCFYVNTDDHIEFHHDNGSSYDIRHRTTAEFRDPSAWYHAVVAVDTTVSEPSHRVRLYVNGKQITSFNSSVNIVASQNLELVMVPASQPFNIGHQYTYGDAYLSDFYFIDGLALSPAAFGEFSSDGSGVWNPKALGRPTPNNGTTWSTTGLTSPDGTISNPEHLFDGKSNTFCGGSNDHTVQWTLTTPISVTSTVSLGSGGADGEYVINPGKDNELIVQTSGSLGGSTEYKTVDFTGDYYGFKFKPSSGGFWAQGIKIDGVLLIDGMTDSSTRNNPNNGTKWSDHLAASASGAWSGHPFSQGFNGTTANDTLTDNSGATLTLTFPTAITASKLEIQVFHDTRTNAESTTISGTGITSTTFSGNDSLTNFKEIPLSGSTISTITIAVANQRAGIAGIKIDDQFLLDSAFDNSFHLKFNDTSLNRYLGKDTLNGKIADATGGLPIYNTTDDYGDVKGSGTRTDSDSSNLKLAIAGDAFTDSSGNSVNVAATNAVISTDQSRFYGSSIKFDGTGDYITTGTGLWSANGDATFEAWLWIDNFSDNHTIMHTADAASGDSSSDICIMTDKQIRLHPTSANAHDTPSVLVEKQWFHLAVVQSSSTRKVYINGINQTLTAVAGNGLTAAWDEATETMYIGEENMRDHFHGYMQDIRVYDKQKYTANFTPPTRNDFTVNNLTASSANLEVQPSKQFNTLLYSGNSSNGHAITGLGFKPDLVWIKCRNNGKWPALADSVRGGGKIFNPNDYSAEQSGDHIKSFDDDGFTVDHVDTGTTNGAFDYVAWCWKAGGTASSNSDGSITTSVSVNPNNTFSIIKYTGTGSNATLGHGLNKAPKMFIIKSIDDSDHFYVYHYEAGANKYLALDQYDGSQTSTTIWQNDHPSSSVIKIGGINAVNESGDDYICYAFAEQDGLCAIGKYTGNGSNSGPTVNVGFKPAWITVKNSESDGATPSWLMVDSVRGTDKRLWNNFGGNSGDTESTQASYTFSNTGFTITDDGSHFNGNNKEYYYLTFAQDLSSGAYGGENIDSLVDTPTNYGTDTGAGGEIRGNYCTWNPLTIVNAGSQALSLKQGNLYLDSNNNGWGLIKGTMAVSTGKWYFEANVLTDAYSDATGQSNNAIGVLKTTENPTPDNPNALTVGAWYGGAGWSRFWNSTWTDHSQKLLAGDVIGVAIDCSARKVTFYRNNSQVSTASSLWTAGEFVMPAQVAYYSGYDDLSLNFGQRAFKYTAPSGFKALCTQNLDDIFSGDELNNPSKYFDVLTYKGTGAVNTVRGLNFQPDLIWIKNRGTSSTSHSIYDAVRGQGSNGYLRIESDDDDGQVDQSNLTAINSDGFTLTSDGNYTNGTNANHIAWCWDAGTAASGANDDGSIDIASGNQWKNATAGFSITKYTGPGSGDFTFGHGLNAVPEFIIIKQIDATGNWIVQHKGITLGSGRLLLNSTTSADTGHADGYWNSTAPTNTLISIGDNSNVYDSGGTFICYAWTPISGYSSFGKITGNGNADGPFVYTGFKPKYILQKRTDASGHSWSIIDTARDLYNVADTVLGAETSAGEWDDTRFDVLSNGFKIRTTNAGTNANNGTFIYAAFAEHPFKTARAT